ncbi:unnamed protein product [Medioppia subpectinata]|uniref:Pinin/SDK/MemA protein domain-containing protein n=1 Tax=Medioppia subpectinata TaxID=1979941 RepID=A0A7R9L412_9ACAR|nr:unnamed protein product [Medioppia subpectinata]CAG2115008.1 unnamed protein product [Medioppia subpectinata]
MQRVEIHQEWERSHQHLSNYIQTKTKPNLFYLPTKHTPETEKRLQETKDKYRLIVAEKRAKVQKELSEIDELYKKEEQKLLDEEMGDIDTHESNAKENSDETKTLAQNESQISIESNNNSNNIIISDEDNNINVSNETTSGSVVNSAEDTSNGVKTESVEHELVETHEDTIEDKEFEPIYDE